MKWSAQDCCWARPWSDSGEGGYPNQTVRDQQPIVRGAEQDVPIGAVYDKRNPRGLQNPFVRGLTSCMHITPSSVSTMPRKKHSVSWHFQVHCRTQQSSRNVHAVNYRLFRGQYLHVQLNTTPVCFHNYINTGAEVSVITTFTHALVDSPPCWNQTKPSKPLLVPATEAIGMRVQVTSVEQNSTPPPFFL
jgi:hypothetical protein